MDFVNISRGDTLDWKSPDILYQVLHKIQNELNEIVQVSDNANLEKESCVIQIVNLNSKVISDIIEEVFEKIETCAVVYRFTELPKVYNLIESNNQKIAKLDLEWLLKFEKIVLLNINNRENNLEDFACYTGVSIRQLHRRIKSLVGITPNQYIRLLKLDKAKSIIENLSETSVAQVSLSIGYEDTYYFTKIFYNHYKITPKELIKKSMQLI